MIPQRISFLLSTPASRVSNRLLYPVVHEQIRQHSSFHPHHRMYATAVHSVAHPSLNHSTSPLFNPPLQHSMHQSVYPSVRAHDHSHYQLLHKMKDYNCTYSQLKQICHDVLRAVQTKHTSLTLSNLHDDMQSVVKQSIDGSLIGRINHGAPLSFGSVALFASLVTGKDVKPFDGDESTPPLNGFHYMVDSDGAHLRWSKAASRRIVQSCVHFISLLHSVSGFELTASVLSQRNDLKLERLHTHAPSENELQVMLECYHRLVENTGHAWYLYDAEWLVDPANSNAGQGDLLFTNLLGFRMNVECKHITGSHSRKKLVEQTSFYSDTWRNKDAEAVCVLGASYSNEFKLFYQDSEDEMIAVESIRRSVRCMSAVRDHWREQVADATSLIYVKQLKDLIETHSIQPIRSAKNPKILEFFRYPQSTVIQ